MSSRRYAVTRICFIGFGEAARSWSKSLHSTDRCQIHAYDILARTEHRDGLREVASDLDVVLHEDQGAAVKNSDLVVSAVTASQCIDAADNTARFLDAGQSYIDINSVSPDTKRRAAKRIVDAGAEFIDMAVMGPVHPAGHRTSALVSGKLRTVTGNMLKSLGFSYEIVGGFAGDASTVKMIRSLFVKIGRAHV